MRDQLTLTIEGQEQLFPALWTVRSLLQLLSSAICRQKTAENQTDCGAEKILPKQMVVVFN